MTLRLTAALLAAALLPAAPPPLTPAGILEAVNQERTRRGRPALRAEPRLARAAQARADDMARRGYFSHTAPDGASPWDAIRAEGYRYRSVAENIARSYPTAPALLRGWMHSPGHRENLLDRGYTDTGIGVATAPGGPFVVQLFAAPMR